ncbi:MAG: AAA family ATPase, partial [Candidatus Sumerlaeota bacterium]
MKSTGLRPPIDESHDHYQDLHCQVWRTQGSSAPFSERTGAGETLVHGPMGVGKSLLLRRLYWDLFENQDDEIPLISANYASFPFDPVRWSKDLLCESAQQLLAWFARDPALAESRRLDAYELAELCRRRGLLLLGEMIECQFEPGRSREDSRAQVGRAMEALAETANTLERPAVLLIDGADQAHWQEEGERVYLSRVVSALEETGGRLRRVWSSSVSPREMHPLLPAPPRAEKTIELKPLSPSGAEAFFEALARLQNIDYDSELLREHIGMFGGLPLFIANFLRTAVRTGRNVLLSPEDMVDVYLDDLLEGSTARDIRLALETNGRRRSPEALARAMAEALDWPERALEGYGFRGRRMIVRGSTKDNDRYLGQLAEAGLCEYRGGRWRPAKAPALADFMRLFIAEYAGEISLAEARVTLKRDLLIAAPERRHRDKARERLEDIALVMRHFRGQNIPSVLLGAPEAPPDAATEQSAEDAKSHVRLPNCIGAYLETSTPGATTDGRDSAEMPVVVGRCFGEQNAWYRSEESVWVAHVSSALVITTEELDYFERVHDYIARELGVSRVFGWLISNARYSHDARERIRTMPLYCSTLSGFQELGERVLSTSKRREQAPPASPELPVASGDEEVMEDVTMIEPQREQLGRNSIELRLPPRSGVELFASRALEDLAASVGYPHEAIGQMQSAVIEGV